MPELPVIIKGMAGVRMRQDPLEVENDAFVFARNMEFREGNIQTRPHIDYVTLGCAGQFQGTHWFTPDRGISAQSYSKSPTAIAVMVGQELFFTPVNGGEFGKTYQIECAPTTGDVNFIDAENHLIILDGNIAQWWSGGTKTVVSKGFKECPKDYSHDTFLEEKHENYIPHQAYTGVYTDGRVLVAVNTKSENCFGQETSAIWVSDILGKRGTICHSGDILLMEEQMKPSMGAPLVHPSRMGKTITLAVLPSSDKNGDDFTIDFAQDGAGIHTVLLPNREALANPDGTEAREGWDTQRLSNAGTLQSVSAVSRYSEHDLPKDILFQSDHGLHFFKTTLGEGSFNTENTKHLSHDIEPLVDLDEDKKGNTVGYWAEGNRYFTSLGLRQDIRYTSSAAARGFASLNQATRFTRDRTPQMEWEGLWEPDCGIWGIHRFLRGGERKTSKTYGFVCSDNDTDIWYGRFNKDSQGYDTRDGEEFPIDWEIWTKAHVVSGISIEDEINKGQISVEVDESTKSLAVDIWSDRCQRWEEWKSFTVCEPQKSVFTKGLGMPSEDSRKGSWFQFRVRGEGWVNIRRLTVEYVKESNQQDQPDKCVPLKTETPNYFRCGA